MLIVRDWFKAESMNLIVNLYFQFFFSFDREVIKYLTTSNPLIVNGGTNYNLASGKPQFDD